LVELLEKSPIKVIFPMHPRTESAIKKHQLWGKINEISNVKIIPAVGYIDILHLVNHAKIILTDSGGLQKEAFYAGKPTMILFYATPWPQVEESGWQKRYWINNGIDTKLIMDEMLTFPIPSKKPDFFGDGNASIKIIDVLEDKGWLVKR